MNATLSTYEQMQMLVVMPEAWSIEKGTLTPTMKLKRAGIEAAVKDRLEGWYASKNTVQWA